MRSNAYWSSQSIMAVIKDIRPMTSLDQNKPSMIKIVTCCISSHAPIQTLLSIHHRKVDDKWGTRKLIGLTHQRWIAWCRVVLCVLKYTMNATLQY
jgi:hypothetical protein